MSDAIECRQANDADYPSIINMLSNRDELFLVFPRASHPFDQAQMQSLSQDREYLTVLTVENEVAGFANFYDINEDRFAFIGNVIVHRDFRGRGLSRRLLACMMDIGFNKLRVPELRVSVFSHNTPAVLLYNNIGFKPYAIEQRRDFDDNPVALLHMSYKVEQHQHPGSMC